MKNQAPVIIGRTQIPQIEKYLELFALHKLSKGATKYSIKRKLDFLRLKIDNHFRCVACKGQEPDIILERDHIVSKKRGGNNKPENIQLLCRGCNHHKFTRTINYALGDTEVRKRPKFTV